MSTSHCHKDNYISISNCNRCIPIILYHVSQTWCCGCQYCRGFGCCRCVSRGCRCWLRSSLFCCRCNACRSLLHRGGDYYI